MTIQEFTGSITLRVLDDGVKNYFCGKAMIPPSMLNTRV